VQRDRVPDTDHISRYCGGAQILPDGRISGTAFRLRELEQYLSVNWLEYLGLGDRDSEIAEVRRVLVAKGRNLGTTARLAVLNAGVLREHVASASADHRVLDILHEPEPNDSEGKRFRRLLVTSKPGLVEVWVLEFPGTPGALAMIFGLFAAGVDWVDYFSASDTSPSGAGCPGSAIMSLPYLRFLARTSSPWLERLTARPRMPIC